MALPETEHFIAEKLLAEFCTRRIPVHVRDQIRLLFSIKGNKVVLVESRPVYDDPSHRWTEMPIAQFEYSAAAKSWSLYGYNRNDRRVPVAKGALDVLINEVDADRTGVFWG